MSFRRLEQYRTGGTGSKMLLALPLPKTPDGRVYRFSPSEDAEPRHFVLGDIVADVDVTETLSARMKVTPTGDETVCPYSGETGPDQSFTHPDDHKAAIELLKHLALQDMRDKLSDALKGLKNFKVQRGARVASPKPRFARNDLLRELICDHCGRDYGVFAIGLFCPGCGAPNLRLHFAREAELVGSQVDVAESLGAGKDELAYRLLGNAHEDVLTAFEATQKAVYRYGTVKAGASVPPKVSNDFQNVDKALKRFAELDLNPFDTLTDAEAAVLRLNIQKRHLIGHNLGVVDDKFAAHSADAKVGETVHLVGEDIRVFAAICQKVVDRLDGWLSGSPSPTIGDAPLLAKVREPAVNPDDPKDLMSLDLQLSLLARTIALWVAEQCEHGMGVRFIDPSKLRAQFEGVSDRDLAEAVAELEADGFVNCFRESGGGPPHFQPELELYLTFDAIAHRTDANADAAALIERILEGNDAVRTADLHQSIGWDRRRFNPALAHVLSRMRSGAVSRELNAEYPTRSFRLAAEDRVSLKRTLQRLRG